jgi:hypothetical protein
MEAPVITTTFSATPILLSFILLFTVGSQGRKGIHNSQGLARSRQISAALVSAAISKKPNPCHSEARFTWRGICFLPAAEQQIPRAIMPRFGMTIFFGICKSHESFAWHPHNRHKRGVQSWNSPRTRGKALEFLREPSPVVSAGSGPIPGDTLAAAHL